MKTAIDAVDWYRGNYFVAGEHEKHHTHLVKGKDEGFYSAYALDVDLEASICSIQEYNELVTQLSHKAGEYEFNQYLISDKTPLTKEVDYASEEFWKDAPEGATHYYKGDFWKPVNGIMFRWEKKELLDHSNKYMHWARTDYVEQMTEKMTLRPQPKPVYTQEMHDKGRAVEAGMMFATEAGKYTAEYTNKKSICFTDEDGFLVSITQGMAKPIDTRTDKEKAIDDMVKMLGRSIAYKDVAEHFYNKWSKGNE